MDGLQIIYQKSFCNQYDFDPPIKDKLNKDAFSLFIANYINKV